MTNLPLAGIKVADFTQIILGATCTQMLGDWGADVIKVERPNAGDLLRNVNVDGGAATDPSSLFCSVNRNKRSLAVDLGTEEGRAIVDELVRRSDVVVSNFRPGVMDRLGYGFDRAGELNPNIVWAAGTGYGADGPYRNWPGQDMLAQAMTGMTARLAPSGQPVDLYPVSIADYTAGMHLAQGILLALLNRERCQRPQRVDVSLYDSMLAAQQQEATVQLMSGQSFSWGDQPINGVYEANDGSIVIVGAFRDQPLARVSRALGIPDLSKDSRFATPDRLYANRRHLAKVIAERIAQGPAAKWLAGLTTEGVLCAPVRTLAQALEDEQTHRNGMRLEITRGDGSAIRTVGSPVHLSSTGQVGHIAPPRLGEHSYAVLQSLGYQGRTARELISSGIVQQPELGPAFTFEGDLSDRS